MVVRLLGRAGGQVGHARPRRHAQRQRAHGGGDGHVANLAALRDFKAWTTGTTATVLATCATAQDVPFFYGTDGIQHDFKHAEQTGYAENPVRSCRPARASFCARDAYEDYAPHAPTYYLERTLHFSRELSQRATSSEL